jgi:integrase
MPSGSVIPYKGKRGAVWRIKYRDAEGKQVMETVGAERDGVTEKVAQAELRERLVRVERKGYRKPKPLGFADYAATWLAEGKVRRGWKPGTVDSYTYALSLLLPHFGSMRLASIRPRDVAAFTREKIETHSPATVNLALTIGFNIFKVAQREELVDSNPFAQAERPKIKLRKWRILEPVEVARVLKAFTDERARTVFLTLSLTGLRRNELINLRWRDVDLTFGVLRVEDAKTEEGNRSIALSPMLTEALIEHLAGSNFTAPGDYVFAHPQRGSRMRHEWYAKAFREALTTAGITDYVRPFHDARHASLTHGAAAGENPIALMARAGHASMQTTKRYLHLAGTIYREEAEALEGRMLGGRKFYQPEPISDDLAEPDRAQETGLSVAPPS